MYKRIRTGLVSTALVAGSFIGAGVVSAQIDDTVPADTPSEQPAPEQPAPETPAPETPAPVDGDCGPRDRGPHDRGTRGPHDRGPRGERGEQHAARAQATADLLGIDVEELHTALEGGLTLVDVAEANGVDVQTIIDAEVAAVTERINAAVESGRLTADEAAEKLADVEERVTTGVNEGRPERDDRPGRSGAGGHVSGHADGGAPEVADEPAG